MPDSFQSAEITPNGISIKVGTHRRAIGVKDYASKAEFQAAVAALLEDVLGKDLAAIAANVAAAETNATATVQAMQAAHAAEKAKLESDLAVLGTKEEAQAIRKAQEIAKVQAQIAADTARLAELSK